MKKKKALCAILCVLIAASFAAAGLWGYREMRSRREITSFEKITLAESGMRFSREYEILCSDGRAEVCLYRISYAGGEDQRIPEKRAGCAADEVLALLNDCRIFGWDGFVGKHPRAVSDGTMFTFRAIVNNGETIYAHGSQNFPKRYREFTAGLERILAGAEE